MSLHYAPVKWNRNKLLYDGWMLFGVVLYLTAFVVIGRGIWPGSLEVLLIRAFGSCALIMLHLVLCIGPLARFDSRVLPVLYNRRHLGVATFIMGLLHGILSFGYYHGFGEVNAFISLLTSNTNYASLAAFPFEILGVVALIVLFLMAATSHDFWLKNLSPATWKYLHMMVYPAYGLLIWHVALGVMQREQHFAYLLLLGLGVALVTGLHLAAAWKELTKDRGVA